MNSKLIQTIKHELRSLSEQRRFKPTSSVCSQLIRPTKPQIYQAIKEYELKTVGDILDFIETVIDNSPPETAGVFEAMYLDLPKGVSPDTPTSSRDPKIIGFLLLAGTCWLFWRCLGGEGVV